MIPRSVNVDEKSTTNAGASSDSAKDLASTTTKENDEEKEEDEEEDGNTDEVQVTNRDENVATSGSKTEDTTSMTETGGSTAPAPEMSNSTAVARLVWLHYTWLYYSHFVAELHSLAATFLSVILCPKSRHGSIKYIVD